MIGESEGAEDSKVMGELNEPWGEFSGVEIGEVGRGKGSRSSTKG
jgi:hypothetical protein